MAQHEAQPAGFEKPTRFAAISVSASGDSTIVAAVTGKRIKVLGFMFQLAGVLATSAKWKSGASTDLTGAFSLQTREGLALSLHDPMFATAAGEALVLNLTVASAVAGFVTYHDSDAY